MEKIEYGDVNKFLVSTGTVLIGLSMAVPYFYLKEDFGLLIETDKLKDLAPSVQHLICQKQHFVLVVQKFIPWTVSILFLSGSGLIFWGLKRWFKRQYRIDRMETLDLLKSEREWEQLTDSEKVEKAKIEIKTNEVAEFIENKRTTEPPKNEVDKYLGIEQRAIEIFKKYQTDNFDIFDNVRLSDRYEFDLLLKAKTNSFADRIIEVRYASKTLPYEIVRSAIEKLDKYVDFYVKTYQRKVVPVLLIVFADQTNMTNEKLRELRQRAGSEASSFITLQRININFINENDLDTFDVKSVLRK